MDGKTVVTYDINPDATYNDGTPLDWRVFENTWKLSNGENKDIVVNSTDGYDLIESVAAGESDKQVVVTFKQTYPWWPALFSILMHPGVADAQTFNEGYLKNPHPEWGLARIRWISTTITAALCRLCPMKSGGGRSRSWIG